MSGGQFTWGGVPTTGESPALLSAIQQAVLALGGSGVNVTSARRPPGPGNDVKNSNHITGDALDGYALIDGQQVPIGKALLSDASKFGLRSGDVSGFDPKTAGGYDPIHVDDGANVGGTKPYSLATAASSPGATASQPSLAKAADSSGWPSSAGLAYTDALKDGLTPAQATDFASVQYGESGFNPSAVNKSSGAAGLYQLLSPGYVSKANALGGVLNPQANIEAILPNFVDYYKSHPGSLVPGAAGATVEASGEPASYYAQGYQHLNGSSPAPLAAAATVSPPSAPAPLNRQGFAAGLIGAMNHSGGIDANGLLQAIAALRT